MDDIYKLQQRVVEIDEYLSVKNLTPEQQTAFLDMQNHLKNQIRKKIEDDIKRQIRSEITRQTEENMGPIVGESRGETYIPQTQDQYGGVKSYGSDSYSVSDRKIHPNLTYDDKGTMSPRILELRRLLWTGRPSRI